MTGLQHGDAVRQPLAAGRVPDPGQRDTLRDTVTQQVAQCASHGHRCLAEAQHNDVPKRAQVIRSAGYAQQVAFAGQGARNRRARIDRIQRGVENRQDARASLWIGFQNQRN